tara:strand:- start:879 stop:1178 length:300 start_codon:yes stop_codon:yes gene_type:complete
MVRGTVIDGIGYEHKVPTANVEMSEPYLPIGVWFGIAFSNGRKLGPCACWVLPHQPEICESYIAGWEGSLYGEELEIRDMRQVSRGEMKAMYDRALLNE